MQKRKALASDALDWSLADKSPLQYLIQPKKLSGFFDDVWEKGPKLYEGNADRKAMFPTLGSLSALKGLLKEDDDLELEFGVDLNAARYVDSIRETVCPNDKAVTLDSVTALYEDGCTLQWHQPQRWVKNLWRLIAAMEKQLGCLVGANAYITPPQTQGLAPHYDDVDLWVCQAEGSKQWRIYKNRPGYELPAVSSRDFDQDVLGDPILDVTLKVGDVLFMPRGTVHQAVAQDQGSCHVTISTNQRWALADFASALVQTLQQGQPATSVNGATAPLPEPLRKGLPVGFLYTSGLQADLLISSYAAKTSAQVAADAASALKDLAERVASDPQLTSLAADTMALDFMMSRAPPHPEQLPEKGPAPSISSRVHCIGTGFCRLLPCQPSAEVMDAYSDEKQFVRVVSCLHNDISCHMMPGSCGHDHGHSDDSEEDESSEEQEKNPSNGISTSARWSKKGEAPATKEETAASSDEDDESEENGEGGPGGDLVFPISFARALAQLLSAGEPIAVKDLKLRTKEDKLGLSYSLWEEGIICTLTEPRAKKQKT